MEWIYDADWVSNALAGAASVISLGMGVPSLTLAVRANRTAQRVEWLEINRDAGPLLKQYAEKAEQILDLKRAGELNDNLEAQSELKSTLVDLRRIFSDRKRVQDYFHKVEIYSEVALTASRIIERNWLRQISSDGDMYDDECDRFLVTIRNHASRLLAGVNDYRLIKNLRKDILKQGPEVREALEWASHFIELEVVRPRGEI